MKNDEAALLLSTVHFTARPDLRAHFAAKAREILRLRGRSMRVRLTLTYETPSHSEPCFAACARLERAGPDLITHAEGAEPAIAGDGALEKLARLATSQTQRRARSRRVKAPLERGELRPVS